MKTERSVPRLLLAFLYAVLAAAPLAAQYQGVSLGLGVEENTVTLWQGGEKPDALIRWSDGDLGLGALFTVEGRLSRFFALDFHATVSTFQSRLSDIGSDATFISAEAQLYLRFYPFAPKEMRQGGVEFFLGAGGGVLATMNGLDLHNSRGSPEFGGITGFRFRLGSYFYLEPFVRASYQPVLFGAGITAGFRFPARTTPEPVVETEPPEETPEEPPSPSTEAAGPPISEIFVLIFEPNGARFDGLDEATARKNEETIATILKLLEDHPTARLFIEGYANPVLGTQKEERQTLRPLSLSRAAYIVHTFMERGIAPERLTYIGEGGIRPVAAFEDRENWGQNRRAEIRIIW
jgi:outer membrane protein OmpA-like peptidoglycan-associated protein